jgi:carboxymethylenebutenolidase
MSSLDKKQRGVDRRNFITGTAAGAVGGMVIGAARAVRAAQTPAETRPSTPAGRVIYRAMHAEMVQMIGHQGDTIDAYLALPSAPGAYPGVVVIHHMPGWDEQSMELARKFAHHGYAAICPNLHFREGKDTSEANSDSVRAAGGMPDDRTMGDVDGAIKFLRSQRYLNGKVGIIGYCSGGRQVYLAACTLKGIDAAVDCYGGGVGDGAAAQRGVQSIDPLDLTKDLSCPLLGLFGKEDKRPSPEAVAKTEAELKKWGKTYEFHSYDNAGHGFFGVGRSDFREAAALDGWKRVFAWFDKYLR